MRMIQKIERDGSEIEIEDIDSVTGVRHTWTMSVGLYEEIKKDYVTGRDVSEITQCSGLSANYLHEMATMGGWFASRTCQDCRGTGTVDLLVHTVDCTTCDGSGSLESRCAECNGKGKVVYPPTFEVESCGACQ